MPVISVAITEIDHDRLEGEYAALVAAWPTLGHETAVPTFAKWLGSRLVLIAETTPDPLALGDIRLFNAIEKLVTGLPQHGFNLAHTAMTETDLPTSCAALAQTLVANFKMQPQYAKRLQELFAHYSKSPKEIADAAQVGITNRAYGALTEVHRQLTERTSHAIVKLGVEKAIGRIEGATAILVGLEVMDRTTAKRRTSAFKAKAMALKKLSWVGRIFKED